MTFRRGSRLGVDVGSVRVGVARCDPDGILAVPVTTLTRDDAVFEAIAKLALEFEVIEVLVGHPVRLNGAIGPAAEAATAFAERLTKELEMPVRLVDERMTTSSAQRSLHAAGRDTRGSRSVIDQQAAALIVQTAIDAEKTTGRPPGAIVEVT